MKTERCGNCKFYHVELEVTSGSNSDEMLHEDDFHAECRRYPPALAANENFKAMKTADVLSDFYSYPIVRKLGWCGEWKQCTDDSSKIDRH